jgi:hypothetical protein
MLIHAGRKRRNKEKRREGNKGREEEMQSKSSLKITKEEAINK